MHGELPLALREMQFPELAPLPERQAFRTNRPTMALNLGNVANEQGRIRFDEVTKAAEAAGVSVIEVQDPNKETGVMKKVLPPHLWALTFANQHRDRFPLTLDEYKKLSSAEQTWIRKTFSYHKFTLVTPFFMNGEYHQPAFQHRPTGKGVGQFFCSEDTDYTVATQLDFSNPDSPEVQVVFGSHRQIAENSAKQFILARKRIGDKDLTNASFTALVGDLALQIDRSVEREQTRDQTVPSITIEHADLAECIGFTLSIPHFDTNGRQYELITIEKLTENDVFQKRIIDIINDPELDPLEIFQWLAQLRFSDKPKFLQSVAQGIRHRYEDFRAQYGVDQRITWRDFGLIIGNDLIMRSIIGKLPQYADAITSLGTVEGAIRAKMLGEEYDHSVRLLHQQAQRADLQYASLLMHDDIFTLSIQMAQDKLLALAPKINEFTALVRADDLVGVNKLLQDNRDVVLYLRKLANVANQGEDSALAAIEVGFTRLETYLDKQAEAAPNSLETGLSVRDMNFIKKDVVPALISLNIIPPTLNSDNGNI